MRDLVFVHGRAQQHKDSKTLKDEWIAAWAEGLKKSGLSVPLLDTQIHFPYYGDTLDQLVGGKSPEDAAKIVVRGEAPGADGGLSLEEKAFIEAVLLESVGRFESDPEGEIQRALPSGAIIEKGVLNWGWVQAILEVLDKHVPGASGMSVALATRDVFQYLTNDITRAVIDTGAASAIPEDKEAVVVSHSLGTVVAYNVLRQNSKQRNWSVPLFVTLGSPLAVMVIKQKLAGIKPLGFPANVGSWFNAMDERDVVSLYPLDKVNFPLIPAIDNNTSVHNYTSNAHGISGYLDDKEVAKKVYDAVTEA
ncbi:hypothetical protein U0E23_32270 [Burkholderia stagnalis]|uniref:hypothetical protein n=1 Tax=Burkholderia stagnalis TaxID=1503054 RepID=UPI002AB40DA0|nr:hypothetical protein [Burkholderia stagnalis]MDY7807119.1 hypothetical protein [Burkholderia stagnalis]